MSIPARYCTGYLGDIGIEVSPSPMDFSGWFEAYLGDHWYTFDARHNVPRIGRVLIARGRDASDVRHQHNLRAQYAEEFPRLGRSGGVRRSAAPARGADASRRLDRGRDRGAAMGFSSRGLSRVFERRATLPARKGLVL